MVVRARVAGAYGRPDLSWPRAVLLSGMAGGTAGRGERGAGVGLGLGTVIGLLIAAVVLAVAWVIAESRSSHPLIDMRMMRLPAVWTTNLVSLAARRGDVRDVRIPARVRADPSSSRIDGNQVQPESEGTKFERNQVHQESKGKRELIQNRAELSSSAIRFIENRGEPSSSRIEGGTGGRPESEEKQVSGGKYF